jgi:hypothetical protein
MILTISGNSACHLPGTQAARADTSRRRDRHGGRGSEGDPIEVVMMPPKAAPDFAREVEAAGIEPAKPFRLDRAAFQVRGRWATRASPHLEWLGAPVSML